MEGSKGRHSTSRREFFGVALGFLRRDGDPDIDGDPEEGLLPLESLHLMPVEFLLDVVPVLRSGWQIEIRNNNMKYRGEGERDGVLFFDEVGILAVRAFDGRTNLTQVVERLVEETGHVRDDIVAKVMEAFMKVTERMVFHPRDPITVERPKEESHE